MQVIGTRPLQTTNNKPVLVNISSRNGVGVNSTKSSGTWPISMPITSEDLSFAAKISLKSMYFFNTLNSNINSSNNILKILTARTFESKLNTVTIPTGHYDIESLITYLNKDGVCNAYTSGDAAATNSSTGSQFEGLGSKGDINYPPFFVSISDPARVSFQPYPLGDYNTPGGNWPIRYGGNGYFVKGVYLVIDSTTIPFLKTMGLIELDSYGNAVNGRTISCDLGTFQVIGFDILCEGTTAANSSTTGSRYSYNGIYAGINTAVFTGINSINLSSPLAIAITMENTGMCGRNSYDSFNPTNTVAVVPVSAAYGYQCTYEAGNPFESIISGYTANDFRIQIRYADTGVLVDFQNTDWLMVFKIEFIESDNTRKASDSNAISAGLSNSGLKRPRN